MPFELRELAGPTTQPGAVYACEILVCAFYVICELVLIQNRSIEIIKYKKIRPIRTSSH